MFVVSIPSTHDRRKIQSFLHPFLVLAVTLLIPTLTQPMLHLDFIVSIHAEPLSRPYIAHFTSPFDQSLPRTSKRYREKKDPNHTQNSDGSFLQSQIKWFEQRQEERFHVHSANTESDVQTRPKRTVYPMNKTLGFAINPQCPISLQVSFSTGSSESLPFSSSSSSTTSKSTKVQSQHPIGIHSSPVIYPIHPGDGPGKSILFTRDYDYLDMLTPMYYEKNPSWNDPWKTQNQKRNPKKKKKNEYSDTSTWLRTRDEQFPLLFERSMFGYNLSPLIQDVNADGIPDAILVDYDGAILMVGLDIPSSRSDSSSRTRTRANNMQTTFLEGKRPVQENTRYYLERQIPRLNVRKDWVTVSLNSTRMKEMEQYELDPYHSFFEYNSDAETTTETASNSKKMGNHPNNVEEGSLQVHRIQDKIQIFRGVSGDVLKQDLDLVHVQEKRNRMLPSVQNATSFIHAVHRDPLDTHHRKLQEDTTALVENIEESIVKSIDATEAYPSQNYYGDDMAAGFIRGDDYYPIIHNPGQNEKVEHRTRKNFYNDENYVRLPPHVLASPVYAEIPARYKREGDSPFLVEELLLIPVSYYFDEEEFSGHQRYKRFENLAGGDETESLRGQYVANALIIFDLQNQRFLSNTHLDLSTDFTAPLWGGATDEPAFQHTTQYDERFGAFALASPTVADLDGDGVMEVLIGTSMGLVHCLSLPYGYRNLGFPVQMKFPVEQSVIVEDVFGNSDLEVFIIDSGGNIVCLSHTGETYWHRDLISEEERGQGLRVVKTSSMMMGDVDGDSSMDIVVTVLISLANDVKRVLRIYAVRVGDGENIHAFPQEISLEDYDTSSWEDHMVPLPTPLLVDLHSRERDVVNYAARSRETPHGGRCLGLHIVQPLATVLYILEGCSGCTQAFDVGVEVPSRVLVDDVDGKETLDLVLTTVTGHVFSLQVSDQVPYHPLQSMSHPGVLVHKKSASSALFVHKVDRKYRDVLGVIFFLTFEVIDNRSSPRFNKKENYMVEIRDGPSARRHIFRKIYDATGVYTEKIFLPYGPGYYTLYIRMKNLHGIVYEDVVHFGYNAHYISSLPFLLLAPFFVAIFCMILYFLTCSSVDKVR